jgi:hypothetical protein
LTDRIVPIEPFQGHEIETIIAGDYHWLYEVRNWIFALYWDYFEAVHGLDEEALQAFAKAAF